MPLAPHHTLIDTDIGDDVDDAFALALAARLPELRLIGVTTVAGPTERRAALARSVLHAAGQGHVPVVAGSSTSMPGRNGSARCSHCNILGLADASPVSHTASAPDFIIERSCDTPLTLVALGPLTNIALALRRDPTLAQRARLVAMGGKLGVPYPDWNMRCDPAAVRAVLASSIPITFVGMHLTMRCKTRPEQLRSMFASQSPLARVLSRCVVAWRTRQRRMPILHDPLTVAVAARPELVQIEARRCVMRGGFLLAARSAHPNARVCTQLDLAGFHALLNQHLFGEVEAPALPLARRMLGRFV